MTDFESLLESLEEVPTHQLEQLNQLLAALHQYLPRDNLTEEQMNRRSRLIGRYVARLRAGISDEELNEIIGELRLINLSIMK